MNSILKSLRKAKGLSQQKVAEYLGVSTSAYGQYETGARSMNPDTLLKLSDYFDVSVDALLGRQTNNVIKEDPSVYITKPKEKQEVMIPLVASIRNIGRQDNVIKYISVPTSYITKYGENIVSVMAVGSSMIPTLTPGNYLVCIPGAAWEDGNIVIVDVNDSETIKRIRRTARGGFDLVSDNNKFETMYFSPQDIAKYQVKIIGRVVRSISPEL